MHGGRDHIPAAGKDEAGPGVACVHCGRRCGTLAGGFARIGGVPVCSKPREPDRPDCYRMVMTKFHRLHDCPYCRPSLSHTPQERNHADSP